MSKITLTKLNEHVLSLIKKHKKGIKNNQLAPLLFLDPSSVRHHVDILKRAGKIIRDKKTLAWSVK